MSISTAAVKFPNGTVQWAAFHETGDNLWPHLFDTAYDAYCYGNMLPPPEADRLDQIIKECPEVEIFINGILKYTITGRASSDFRLVIVDGYIPDMKRKPGIPDWFKKIYPSATEESEEHPRFTGTDWSAPPLTIPIPPFTDHDWKLVEVREIPGGAIEVIDAPGFERFGIKTPRLLRENEIEDRYQEWCTWMRGESSSPIWLVDVVNRFKLCYVEDGVAYFTSAPLEEQWGDDWNDAPYEHNAGRPYLKDGYAILKIKYQADLWTPVQLCFCDNSPYSVEEINSGRVAWLSNNKGVNIFAGASIEEFKEKVKEVGGNTLDE